MLNVVSVLIGYRFLVKKSKAGRKRIANPHELVENLAANLVENQVCSQVCSWLE